MKGERERRLVLKKNYYDYTNEEKKPKEKLFSKVDKWGVAKKIVSMIASGCATMVVSRYLKANMPECETVVEKAAVGVGMYFLTGVVGAKVAEYAESEIDSIRSNMAKAKELEEADGGDD